MMAEKGLEISLDGVEELEKMFKPSVVEKGTNSAINKILKKAKTQGVKETRKVYNIGAADLKRNVKVRRSTRSTLQGVLTIVGSRLNLILFKGTRQVKKGVSVMVKRGERVLKLHAFISPISGKNLVFKREGDDRLPIISQTAKGPVGMFEDEGLKEVERLIDTELNDLIFKETIFFQDKAKGL